MKNFIAFILLMSATQFAMAQTFGDISKRLTNKIHSKLPREKAEQFTRQAIKTITGDADFEKAVFDTIKKNDLSADDIVDLSPDEMDDFERDFVNSYDEYVNDDED